MAEIRLIGVKCLQLAIKITRIKLRFGLFLRLYSTQLVRRNEMKIRIFLVILVPELFHINMIKLPDFESLRKELYL